MHEIADITADGRICYREATSASSDKVFCRDRDLGGTIAERTKVAAAGTWKDTG